jgi:hypothetical protein
MIFRKGKDMSLRAWEKAWTRHKVKALEFSDTTKFWLCRDAKSPATAQWTILCERRIEDTGTIEEIILFGADTESATRKAFRALRRVTGYTKCDNGVAIPGLF